VPRHLSRCNVLPSQGSHASRPLRSHALYSRVRRDSGVFKGHHTRTSWLQQLGMGRPSAASAAFSSRRVCSVAMNINRTQVGVVHGIQGTNTATQAEAGARRRQLPLPGGPPPFRNWSSRPPPPPVHVKATGRTAGCSCCPPFPATSQDHLSSFSIHTPSSAS
jgi:hypothetical protein